MLLSLLAAVVFTSSSGTSKMFTDFGIETSVTEVEAASTSISFITDYFVLYKNGRMPLTELIDLKNPVGKTTYGSDNMYVAVVNANGEIMGTGLGVCTVSARNNGKTVSVRVRVAPRNFSPIWPCDGTYIETMFRYYNYGNIKPHSCFSNKGAVGYTASNPGNVYNAFDVSGGGKIYAVEQGIVIETGYKSNGFGNYVKVLHPNGDVTLYAHMKSKCPLSRGARVSKKTQLGVMGSTGKSTGVHLHFEMYYWFNPYNNKINVFSKYYMNKVNVTIGGNSYLANKPYISKDTYAKEWCNWLTTKCKKKSNGDYYFKKG